MKNIFYAHKVKWNANIHTIYMQYSYTQIWVFRFNNEIAILHNDKIEGVIYMRHESFLVEM